MCSTFVKMLLAVSIVIGYAKIMVWSLFDEKNWCLAL